MGAVGWSEVEVEDLFETEADGVFLLRFTVNQMQAGQ